MQLMKKFTSRLNLHICPETYDKIEKVATKKGIKPGSMTRSILLKWVREQEIKDRKGRG